MKKLNLEKILLIFIVICPILDITSFLFRNNFGTSMSPSTFIRPIIPLIGIIIIFLKNDFKLKLKIILASIIYGSYAIIHLLVFESVKTGSSYGVITHEMQYLINYTYMILNLFIYMFVFKKQENDGIKKAILASALIYILSIYISIFTNTSSTTYLEGIGKKGWFESGNSISSILILMLFILFPMLRDKKISKIAIPTILLIAIFLMTLIGTRVGLFGVIIVAFFYAVSEVFITILKKNKLNKKVIAIVSCTVLVIIGFIGIKGSDTLKRRAYLKEVSAQVVDSSTGEASHITGDLLEVKQKIDNNTLEDGYMSEASKKALNSLYEFANKYEISNSDKRVQQIVYNTYQVIYQKNIVTFLFGNGFLTNIREMILEMEIPAFLFNFGLFGFILYFIPFLSIFIYGAYIGIKNIKSLDTEYIMLVLGSGFSFVLSFFAGYTFFNSSTMMIIILISVMLINKTSLYKQKR